MIEVVSIFSKLPKTVGYDWKTEKKSRIFEKFDSRVFDENLSPIFSP